MIKDYILQNKTYASILFLNIFVLIFANILPGFIFLVLGSICWIIVFKDNKEEYDLFTLIIKMYIFSLPLSFTNVFGSGSGYSNITWFNIFFIILVLLGVMDLLKTKKIELSLLSKAAIAMMVVSLIPLFVSVDFIDGLKQYIYYFMACSVIIMGERIKNQITVKQKSELLLDYLFTTRVAAIGVMLQMFYIGITGHEIGHYRVYGTRQLYGFLFSDFSFLSLFIASGAVGIYFYKRKQTESKKYWMAEFVLLLIASVVTSARTGMMAFIAVFIIFNGLEIISLAIKGSRKAIILLISNLGIIIVGLIGLSLVRPESLISDSGRSDLNQLALNTFLENPLLGMGFGGSSYANLVGMIPHNIIYQSLAQGGLLFTIPLFLFVGTILYTAYKENAYVFSSILVVLIGSLFIPDIFNSRFFPVLLLLLAMKHSSLITNERISFSEVKYFLASMKSKLKE